MRKVGENYLNNVYSHSVCNLLSSCLYQKTKIKDFKTIIFPVLLCGCEGCSLIVREEHTPRLFKDRVPRRIVGPIRGEVIVSWRKLHNYELHNFCYLQNIIIMIKSRTMRWGGHVAHMGEKLNLYVDLMGKLKGRRPLARPIYRREGSIKIYLTEIE
jgi:hypothetical protein